ncbi:DUF1801 domain-containing protein [Winogradskyella pulchriflava]|uniref:DUF1801 domain-containing protein n=1 Tax=Winogradskyella pulchriflava TaxID=1110688 RepID=A0ABV6Q615_9FLAO
MNPKVDTYLSKVEKWQEELETLRSIILKCGLKEDFKWRNPCYTFKEKNIAIIGGFKDYCTISFLKGSLLKDTEQILVMPGPNSRVAKLIQFKSVAEIIELESVIKNYLYEAIEIEKAGLKVNLASKDDIEYPVELNDKFKENPKFQLAFKNLTPGRQRGYILYFNGAKQSKTRMTRIEKYEQRIFNGKGFHDCVCGKSKKMPNCDGSHKYI